MVIRMSAELCVKCESGRTQVVFVESFDGTSSRGMAVRPGRTG